MKGVEDLTIRDAADGAIIPVKAIPGASRDRVSGVLGDALKVATSTPAEKGKANAAIARILAKALGASHKDIRLVSGQTNPRKEFLVAGVSAELVRRKLG